MQNWFTKGPCLLGTKQCDTKTCKAAGETKHALRVHSVLHSKEPRSPRMRILRQYNSEVEQQHHFHGRPHTCRSTAFTSVPFRFSGPGFHSSAGWTSPPQFNFFDLYILWCCPFTWPICYLFLCIVAWVVMWWPPLFFSLTSLTERRSAGFIQAASRFFVLAPCIGNIFPISGRIQGPYLVFLHHSLGQHMRGNLQHLEIKRFVVRTHEQNCRTAAVLKMLKLIFLCCSRSSSWHCRSENLLLTNSTAQGGGGSLNILKRIGEADCCEWRMSEQKHWPTD